MELGSHDLVLGLAWLRKHNPDTDWSKDQIDVYKKRLHAQYPSISSPEAPPYLKKQVR